MNSFYIFFFWITMSQKLEYDTFWDFLQFSCPCHPSSFPLHSSNNNIWKCFDEAKAVFFLLLHEWTHHIGLTTWSVIICLNECHAILYCLSPDSNTSLYWQVFWKHNSPHGTNEKTKQGKCTANNEWTQFAKGIYTYKQCEAKCTLQKAGGRWTLKHIYLAIHFSGGLISKGSVEAEQKYNTVSNMAEEVRNKVNERFKAP